MVDTPRLKEPLFAPRLVQKPLAPGRRLPWHALVVPDALPVAVAALEHNAIVVVVAAVNVIGAVAIVVLLFVCLVGCRAISATDTTSTTSTTSTTTMSMVLAQRCGALAHAEQIHAAQRRPVQERLVGVRIALEARVNEPAHELERLAKARRQLVADGRVKVVAEHELVAADG